MIGYHRACVTHQQQPSIRVVIIIIFIIMATRKNATEPILAKDHSIFLPDREASGNLYDFYQKSFETARQVIKVRMPTKILDLNNVLAKKDGYEEFFTKYLKVDRASKRVKESIEDKTYFDQEYNVEQSQMFKLAEEEFVLLKVEVLELVDMTSSVKLWLQLNVPRIEDGNNFGVSIQTDTVTELARVEDSALMTFENWTKFLSIRAKLVGKMHKHETSQGHPLVEEAYKRTLEALDEKQLRSVWIAWLDLRNNYAVIHDLIVKNIEKLVNPRSTNATSMY